MRHFILLAFAFGLLSCDGQSDAPASPVDETPPPTDAPKPAEKPEPPPPETIADADAQKVLDAWLAAQNTGNFAAYKALYAPKFEGVKRVGPKTSRYDQAGWLADRERMFKKQVEVSADDVQINTSSAAAVVRFTQTWASGSFKDVGPKQLVLAKSKSGLLVAREEMLSSTVVGTGAEPPPYDATSFGLVTDSSLVLAPNADDSWGSGKPTSKLRGSAAERAVGPKLPKQYSDLVGAPIVTFDAAGTPCETKVSSLALVARVTPHFGDVQMWDGEMGEPRFSDAQVAAQVWELAGDAGRMLVSRLEPGCKKAVWAKGAEAPTKPLAATAPSEELKTAAISRFRSLPGWRAIQSDFESYQGEDNWDDAGKIEVRKFGPYVYVGATAGGGCGNFIGSFWALWETSGPKFLLLSDPKTPGDFVVPDAAAQLPDGKSLYFGDDQLIAPQADTWRPSHSVKEPFLDCPC